MNVYYILFWFVWVALFLFFLDRHVLKKTKFGFYIVMWEFWAWKTQNTTAYLKKYKYWEEINITNYYTWYSHFQVSSYEDLINILNDIYDYHLYINLYEDREKIFKFKKEDLKKYEVQAKIFRATYPNMKKNLKFNIVLDESSIYFNPRNFARNFSWQNERLLDFIYQPRKLNILFFTVVQSPMELDVKFRRLATYYRKYYKGLWFWRFYKDFYFIDPEEIDLEKAEQVGWWFLMGMNLNFYPIYPFYDYNTKELIRPSESIYKKGSLYDYLHYISLNPEKPEEEKVLEWNLSKETFLLLALILTSFFDFLSTCLSISILWNEEINFLYSYILSFNSLTLFFAFRVVLVPFALIYIFLRFEKLKKFVYIPIIFFVIATIINLSWFF